MPDGYTYVTPSVPAGNGCNAADITIPVTTNLQPDTRYRAKVKADNTSGGFGGAVLSDEFFFTTLTICGVPAQPPSVAAPIVSFSTGQTVPTVVHVDCPVNPHGLATSIQCYASTDPTFATGVIGGAVIPAGNGCVLANVRADFQSSILTANTTYYTRFVATSTSTSTSTIPSVISPNTQFVSPGAPTATTKAATSVTATGATLNATINNRGVPSQTFFEFGRTTSYGNTTSPPHNESALTTGQPVAKAITGRVSGTLYHFRVQVVRNDGGGSATGADLTFTTL